MILSRRNFLRVAPGAIALALGIKEARAEKLPLARFQAPYNTNIVPIDLTEATEKVRQARGGRATVTIFDEYADPRTMSDGTLRMELFTVDDERERNRQWLEENYTVPNTQFPAIFDVSSAEWGHVDHMAIYDASTGARLDTPVGYSEGFVRRARELGILPHEDGRFYIDTPTGLVPLDKLDYYFGENTGVKYLRSN